MKTNYVLYLFIFNNFQSRKKAQRRNRIEILLRTTSETPGTIIWTGKSSHIDSGKGYLGLFIQDGYLELRVSLGAKKSKGPVIMRSKVTAINLLASDFYEKLVLLCFCAGEAGVKCDD